MNKYELEREKRHIENKIKDDLIYKKELTKLYNRSLDEIEKRLNYLYTRYAQKEKLALEEAMKIADKTDIKDFEKRVKKYVKNKDFSNTANSDLRLYNFKMRVSRLELMKYEIMLENMKLHGAETEMLYGRLKDELLEESKRQTGILGLGDNVLKKVLKDQEAIINGDFKGTSFSNRIWVNGQELQSNLENGLHRSLILGENPRQWSNMMSEHLKKNMADTGKQNALFNAFRLAVTEASRVQITTGLKLMKEGGYDKYIWIAEPGACHICAPYNNQVFDMKEANIGDTVPPMHPFCRCSVAAYFDMDEEDIDIGDKAREIAEELGYDPLSDSEVVNVLREESKEWINNLSESEKKSISKYTYNGKDSDGLRLFEKINGFLDGRYKPFNDKEKEIILRNAYNINQGLLKNELKHDIIVYRKEKFIDTLDGKVDKFLSTSVSKKGVIGGNPNVAIIVPKDSIGAYIENMSKLKRQREFLLNTNTKLNEVFRNKDFVILEVK